jgi:hypothetical protein
MSTKFASRGISTSTGQRGSKDSRSATKATEARGSRGPLADEAALHGVLIKVRDLALPLLAMQRITGSRAELEDAGYS